MTSNAHLGVELPRLSKKIAVETRYGLVTGARAANDAAVWLEIPFALPPQRFEDPEKLPDGFRYENREYIYETSYAAQPVVDGQSASTPFHDKVGLGQASENPLFLNIVSPPSFPAKQGFPVKVYIHGGFLQFGSPHGLSSQAQYVSAERSEVWVNIGYRLSAFGFAACDEPLIKGNFGFKDQWMALEWVKENIASFGGNPSDVQITGLSAGAHSVHQLLHHASRLPEGVQAPFQSAILQSNSIVNTPKTPFELRPQYEALCHALKLDPTSSTALSTLKDASQTTADAIVKVIDEDLLGSFGTFRGTLDGQFVPSPSANAIVATSDTMTWQRSGSLARGLLVHGVRCVVVGDLIEEWYLYSIAHPIRKPSDIKANLLRYYTEDIVTKMMDMYRTPQDDETEEELMKLFGEMLSEGQVHLPVRMLARDLKSAGFPVCRYEIRWTPEQIRPKGYVTHGSDRPLWALRVPVLTTPQVDTARAWLEAINKEVENMKTIGPEYNLGDNGGVRRVLALKKDASIGWAEDERWEDIMRLAKALPGEED